MRDREEFLDIKQAARFLNASETSLRRWTKAGLLACVRIGGKRERRFRRADLLAFVEEQPVLRSTSSAPPDRAEGRHTVVAQTSPPTHGSHRCALYASDGDRGDQAVEFLANGLGLGSVCYFVAEPDTRDSVLARLEKDHPTLQADIDAGRLVLSEYEASVDAQLDYWETNFVAAARAGEHSLRVVGDVAGGRLANGKTIDKVVAYEDGYNRLLARRFPVVTLCQYDVRRFAGLDVLKLLKCHQDTLGYPPHTCSAEVILPRRSTTLSNTEMKV